MIPYLLIAVGGVMILSGVKKTNPLAVMKAVLTNSPMPGEAIPVNTESVTPESLAENTLKASTEVAGTTGSPGTMGW